jgi:DNA-binding NtrC family response regulator
MNETKAGGHKRILVADDDEGVRFVLTRALERLGSGYEIVTAPNAQEALDRVKAKPFDLVITDLRMPGMDGVELTKEIKGLNPETTVVWITAYGGYEVADEATRLSVCKCLDKPLKVSEIRQAALEALAATDSRGPVQQQEEESHGATEQACGHSV